MSEEGKRAFSAGVALLQDPDGAKYEEAAAQFRRAYELTKSWKVLGNLGLCLMHLERDGEAIEAYDKYLAGGGKDIAREERAQVERDLATLKAQVATVRVELPAGEATIIDERSNSRGGKIVNKYVTTTGSMQLGLHPGDHVITARSSQGSSDWPTSLDPASSTSHRFAFGQPADATAKPSLTPMSTVAPKTDPVGKPASEPVGAEPQSSSNQRTIGFVVGGTGVAALGIGAFFGLSTFSKWKDAKNACDTTDVCDSSAARSSGNLATVFFAVGGAATAAGVVLVLTAPSSASPAPATAWRIAPALGPGVKGVVAGTVF
jgi:hypothetical protein